MIKCGFYAESYWSLSRSSIIFELFICSISRIWHYCGPG